MEAVTENVKNSNYIEFMKTESLTQGRVRTRVFLFLMDADIFTSICGAYIRGETRILECRMGESIKHPKDKYDKSIGKAEAAKKFKKYKLPVTKVTATDVRCDVSCLFQDHTITVTKWKNDKITIKWREL